MIRLAPVGFRDLRLSLLFAVLFTVLATVFSGLGMWLLWHGPAWDARAFAVFYLSIVLSLTAAGILGLTGIMHMAGNEPEVMITSDKLTIREGSRWRRKTREWSRESVTAFDNDMGGLWVLGRNRRRPVLPERTQPELRWLAQTLAAQWQVPDRELPEPGDVEARALVTDENGKPMKLNGVRRDSSTVERAHVRLRDRQLMIRFEFNRQFPLRFMPYRTRGRWRNLIDGSLPIDADDVTWTEADGQPCFRISPRVPGGEGCDVTVWPDDVEKLRTMLDRFFKRT